MTNYARTLHGLPLFDEKEVAPGLFSAIDDQGYLRLHDGAKFRGYVNGWTKHRFQVQAWGPKGRFTRRTYKTLAGARRALLREGKALNDGGTMGPDEMLRHALTGGAVLLSTSETGLRAEAVSIVEPGMATSTQIG